MCGCRRTSRASGFLHLLGDRVPSDFDWSSARGVYSQSCFSVSPDGDSFGSARLAAVLMSTCIPLLSTTMYIFMSTDAASESSLAAALRVCVPSDRADFDIDAEAVGQYERWLDMSVVPSQDRFVRD